MAAVGSGRGESQGVSDPLALGVGLGISALIGKPYLEPQPPTPTPTPLCSPVLILLGQLLLLPGKVCGGWSPQADGGS